MRPAGKRDKLVTIQQRAEDIDEAGFPHPTWSSLGTAFMERRDLAGRERFAADQIAAVGDRTWAMPYQANMDPDVYDIPKVRRLVYQGFAYDIVHATYEDGVAAKGIVLHTTGRKDPNQP